VGNIFERLAGGPRNLQKQDYNDWNDMVGSAPPEKFGRAAYDAIREVPPDEYYRHTQPGVDGTDPLGELDRNKRTQLAQSLLIELHRRGLSDAEIMQGAGVRTLDPNRMSTQELAALAQWAQREQPKSFGRVAAQHQNEPDVLSGLFGNKALLALGALLGAKYLSDRAKQEKQRRATPSGTPTSSTRM
jgi:hypothetical protein